MGMLTLLQLPPTLLEAKVFAWNRSCTCAQHLSGIARCRLPCLRTLRQPSGPLLSNLAGLSLDKSAYVTECS